jgi:hypothetical protein
MIRKPTRASANVAVKTNAINDTSKGVIGGTDLEFRYVIQGRMRRRALIKQPRKAHDKKRTNDL